VIIPRCKKKEESTSKCIQNCAYIMPEDICQIIILKTLFQFNDKHFNCIKTLTFHLSNGCHNNISTCWLINHNNYIENLSLLIVTNHSIIIFETIVKIHYYKSSFFKGSNCHFWLMDMCIWLKAKGLNDTCICWLINWL